MRTAILLALLVSVLPACKGEKGDMGSPGPSGPSGQNPNPQADLLVFEGDINGNPTAIQIGALGDDRIVLVYVAFASFPTEWLQLGTPTGDNSVEFDMWYSVNSTNGLLHINNAANGDHYKIFVIPVTQLSSFKAGLTTRLSDPY